MSGIIGDIFAPINLAEEIGTFVESTFSAIQTSLMQYEYLAALPIIAAEFKGILDIIEGSWKLFVGTLKALGTKLIPDIFDGVFTFAVFGISWMMCLFKNITNLQACMFYYILEIFGQILYLPIRLLLWVASQFKINLYPIEKFIWDKIEYIDSIIFNYGGFHICHYPKSIREQCYKCRRVKISALDKHTAPLVRDLTVTVPKLLSPGLQQIIKGGTELTHPFNY
jgi:hypothetical protein